MIINPRGTNGSGKSTVIFRFLEAIGGLATLTPHHVPGRSRPLFYTHDERNFALLGSYANVTGGCDTLKDYAQLVALAIGCHESGYNVVLEGCLFSGDVKQTTLIRETVPDFRILVLDTLVPVCISRVISRREKAGKQEPLNPKNLIDKHRCIELALARLTVAGVHIDYVSQERAVECLLQWLPPATVPIPSTGSPAGATQLEGVG